MFRGRVILITRTCGIGHRSIWREIKLEVIIGRTEAADNAESFDRSQGLIDLVDLILGVSWIWPRQFGDGWWISEGAVVGILWLGLTVKQLVTEWNSSGDTDEIC